MTAFKDNLDKLMTEKGLSQYALAKISGVPQPTIQRALKGSNPRQDTVQKLAKALGRSSSELIGDLIEGESSNIDGLTDAYRFKPIPIISWVKAGQFCESPDMFEPGDADGWVPVSAKGAGPNTYALKVVGDSMTSSNPDGATYPEGFIIIIDPDQEVLPGMRGIFKIPETNEATFKELMHDAGKLYLKPLNTRHPLIPVNDEMVVCGKVIGSYRPE